MAKPIFYEFSSKGCAFCAAQKKAKVMEQLAETFPDVDFQRVDADIREDLAEDLGIKGVPCYVLVDDEGEELGRQMGGAPVAKLEKLIEKHFPDDEADEDDSDD